MLRKLIGLFGREQGHDDPATPQVAPSEAASATMRAKARPEAASIIAAVRRNDMIEAKHYLRQWAIGLNRERLPGGDCWVIGGNFFYFEFQWHLVATLEHALAGCESPRIFIGRQAFWRVAAVEMWEAGRFDELRLRLPGVLQLYDPHVYLVWARLLVLDGKPRDAGRFFLFSGLYNETESDLVAQFTQTFARANPNQFVGRIPGPCVTKRARRHFPPKVYDDLAGVNCPSWFKRRPPAQVSSNSNA
ncbi:MAG: hypothetical protein ACJ8GW_18160 [Massilia sp.]